MSLRALNSVLNKRNGECVKQVSNAIDVNSRLFACREALPNQNIL